MSVLRNAVRYAIATAVAGGVATSASALDISTYNAATATNVYISGSTALDNTLINAFIEIAGPGGLCQPNSLDIYFIGTTNRMFFCSASGTAGITANSPLAVFKESNVGSANGVQPLINAAKGVATTLSFVDPSVITDATCVPAATTAASGDFSSYVTHSGCATTAVTSNTIPTGGFTDVEGTLDRTPTGGTIPAADISTYLAGAATLDQIWTLALTKNAYYALQAAEGLTSPSDLPANAPSLSRAEIASLLSNNIYGWSQIGLSPTDDNVYICRRDVGSGSEASFEYLFLGERCGASTLVVPGETTTSGGTIWANASGAACEPVSAI